MPPTYFWRLWTEEAATPRFLLVNESGQLIIDDGYHSIEGTLSGGVVGTIQMTGPGVGMIMADSWGTQTAAIEVGQSAMRIAGVEFTLATMTGWRRVCSEFEVMTTSYGRPTGSGVSQVLVKFGVDVGFGGTRIFGSPSVSGTSLRIETPSDEVPDDPYFVLVWVEWFSADQSVPFDVGDGIVCNASDPNDCPVPQGAIYSFGDLVDY